MSTWTIRLFGGFAVERAGEPLPLLPSRKGIQLIVSLALRFGRARTREELADLIWPVPEPELARNSLRQTLTLLHKWLEDDDAPVLKADRLGVSLSPADARCDLMEFNEALRYAKTADREEDAIGYLRKAIGLVKGPLVPEMPFDWIEPERAHYANQHFAAHLTLASRLAARGDFEEALSVTQKAISIDPLHEEATALLMEIARQADMPNQGLLAFRNLEQRTIAELGLPPSNKLQKLAGQLRTNGLAVVASPSVMVPSSCAKSNVPPLPWPLIGRCEERERLIASLAPINDLNQGQQVLTLTGLGGIGKSHLAIDVARRLVEEYGGAVWFVSLVQAAPHDLERRVADAVLKATTSTESSNLQAIAEAIGDRAALLVIDNAEDILSEVRSFAQAICSHCRALRVFVTSREPLGVCGEVEAQLKSLNIPDTSGNLDQNESVKLYVSRAKKVLSEDQTSRFALADVAQLCRALDGMPLAIVLAASRSSVQSPREMLASVEVFRSQRHGSALGRPERSSTVNSCIAWSCERLGGTAQILGGMSCFVGGCTAGALKALYPDRDIEWDLEKLAAYSLIQVRETDFGTRFDMLESVRQYASGQMEEHEIESARVAHAGFFEGFVRDRAVEFSGGKQSEAISAIAEEDDNTLASFRFLVLYAPERAVQMAIGLAPYWHGRGRCREGVDLAEPLLRSAKGLASESDIATLRHRIAVMQRHLGRYEDALGNMLESVRFRKETKDDLRLAETLNSLANLQIDLGDDVDGALESLREAQALFVRIGHTRGEAMVAGNLGRALHYSGQSDLALNSIQNALALNREMGNKIWEMNNLGELAEIAVIRGELRIAKDLVAQAISISDSLQLKTNPSIFITLSEIHERQEEMDAAYRTLGQALRFARDNSGPLDTGNSLRRVIALLCRDGRLAEASRCAGIEESLRKRSNLPMPRLSAPRLADCLASLEEALGSAFREEFTVGRNWALDPALDWVESLLDFDNLAVPDQDARVAPLAVH